VIILPLEDFKMDIYFVDFEDSFSFNVISEIKKMGLNPQVMNRISWQKKITSTKKSLTILGPGPGHPDDYELNKILKKLVNEKNHYFFGICLGHQLLAQALGFSVSKCQNPVHGQSIQYAIPQAWREYLGFRHSTIKIQRYNSLAPMMGRSNLNPLIHSSWVWENELIAMRGERFLSYQFHPESIGTSYPQAFFKPLRHFPL
jgi:anthranilate/para-aminobenzoate synthase component II